MLAEHISTWEVSAHQDIVLRIASFGAANLAGVGPDDLSIMSDISPIARI